MPRSPFADAAVFGVDLGKTRFDVMAADASGKPLRRAKLTRYTILPFFEQVPRALIGMEACPGAQWLARKLAAMGHTVRIIPAQFVKPFVKSNKNDARDAEAIAEAVVRPTMRFVEIRQEAQIDLQALHRIRDRISANRIQLICQMRAFCLEYGIAMRPGAGVFKLDMARILTDEDNDLTPMMRTLLQELWDEFVVVDARLAAVSKQVEAIADRVDAARRLMSIPGIGPLGATALLAAIGNGRQFRKARDLAAWLGLVPRQNS
ncbi:MAG: IS110 family transposase, partial [Delftia acidovorans]